jgi:hypothetical protein
MEVDADGGDKAVLRVGVRKGWLEADSTGRRRDGTDCVDYQLARHWRIRIT